MQKVLPLYLMPLFIWLLAACSPESGPVQEPEQEPEQQTSQQAPEYDPAHDYFSHANTDAFTTRHLELDLTVDFASQQLRGHVILHMSQLDLAQNKVVLDSRGLLVDQVRLLQADGQHTDLSFDLGET